MSVGRQVHFSHSLVFPFFLSFQLAFLTNIIVFLLFLKHFICAGVREEMRKRAEEKKRLDEAKIEL
jgi:hypothetical protein